jgi:type I restriction enzyme, S subunit
VASVAEWRDQTLGEVLTLQRGFDLPARDRVDGPVPIVSSSGITGRHAIGKVDPPGVVIGRYGTLGQVHWVTERYWPLNTALWVKDFKGNDPRFVSYLLRTVSADGSAASAVPGVNRNHLHRLPVRVPSLPTQRRIAATLAAFDDLIAINERRVKLLEHLARSLYREWFVRFRLPGREVSKLVDSELGLLPAAWEVAPIGRAVSDGGGRITSGPFGSKLGRKDYIDVGVPVIRGANLELGGGFTDDGFVFVSESKADSLRTSIARPGDIVVTQRGTLGQVGLVPTGARYSRYVISQSQMAIAAGTRVSTQYLYAVLRSPETTSRILNMAISAGVPHINLALLREMMIVIPPMDLQERFDERVTPLNRFTEQCRRRISALAGARDLVLPRLVTGRLDISDIDLGALLVSAEDA